AGRVVVTRADLPGGYERSGFEGVQDYIREHRQGDYIDNLSRKLLSYALSRSLIPSDDLLIERMRSQLAANGYRFSATVESIVTSPQFLNRRNADSPGSKGAK